MNICYPGLLFLFCFYVTKICLTITWSYVQGWLSIHGIVSGFLCAFSPNYTVLLSLRFVVGIGLGSSHVLPTWFLEFVPAEDRGSWIAVFTSFWSFGTVLEALLAWVILPYIHA
jgi:MFS family permease